VAVSAQVDNSSRKIRDESVKPEGKGSVRLTAKEVEDTTSEGSGPSAPGNEPGVQSNVAADINRGTTNQAPQNRSSKEKTDTEFVSKFGGRIEESINPGGAPTRINVMVSLSREYIVSLIRAKQPPPAAPAGNATDATTAAPEPTMAEIKVAFDEEKKRLEADLTPLVRTASSAAAVNDASLASIPHVVVSLIPVPQIGATLVGGVPGMQAAGLGGSTSGTGGAMSGLAGQVLTGSFIRTALLGVLAVGALGMMMMLVKKSSKPQALPTAQEIVGLPPVMESTDEVVGEADESSTALEGIELGESEIQAKKRLEAVQEMVSKSPQDAAGLMKRWLSNEK
jgi:flagellar biosynthesis/type III secretory pathway M-ring protein FliF/YscJ